QGIGRAAALALAGAGCAVALAARTASDLDRVAEEIRAMGGRALAVPTDVANEGEVETLVRRTLAEIGPIDILVNDAGTNTRKPIWEVTTEDWQRILGVNTTGTFFCTRAVLPTMMERRSGKIINVSSMAGKIASPTRSAYSAAKFGVVGFGQAIQRELNEYGITISTVFPGPIATAMRRKNNPGEDPSGLVKPEEVGEAILFLATRSSNAVIPELAIYPRSFIAGAE
ncbi:MAG TPA: SDR family oxidoreductase, partial [Chloroflexota bacterium]|nr:SDR family oxidoreductase [Chloroflexota bacterium]